MGKDLKGKELGTMRQYKIPTKIFVFHNGYLGLVREHQHGVYKGNYSVVDLSGNPDLEKLSSAYDIPFIRVKKMDEVDEAIDKFLENDESYIMEAIIDPMDIVK